MRAAAIPTAVYPRSRCGKLKLPYIGHATMDNRHGLAVAGMVTLADGACRAPRLEIMLKAKAKETHSRHGGEDKAYDTAA